MKMPLMLVVACIGLSSCARTPAAADLTGLWTSEPVMSDRGATTQTCCFANDGTTTWVVQSPAGTIRQRGTFKLVGSTLTVESKDMAAPLVKSAALRWDRLILTSKGGSSVTYTKGSGTCEDVGK